MTWVNEGLTQPEVVGHPADTGIAIKNRAA